MTGARWRARLARLGRWLAPSLIATAVALIGAGLVESDGGGPLFVLAGVGVAALVAGPATLALAAVGRWVITAWRPVVLADPPGTAAPRVWAWLVYLVLATAALAAVVMNAVAFFARATAFKPHTLALLLPALVVPATLALVALSRPAVDALAAAIGWLEARRQARGRRPWATARAAVGAGLGLALVAPVAGWYLVARPRLGYVDVSLLRYPLIALALLVPGHALGRRRDRIGRVAGSAALAVLGVAIATALCVWWWRPIHMLELWSRPTVAGLAVDSLFDLERLRGRLSEGGFPPVEVAGAHHPDVILITIDTLRGDRTPVLGGTAPMPTLAGLAGRGASFEWAFAPGNVTRRSLSTIATGAGPSRLRGRLSGWALRMDPRHVAIGERFRAAGYDTAGFFCCRGFFARDLRIGLSRGLDHLTIEHDGAVLAAAANAWLVARQRAGARAPLFVWMHLIELHNWGEESRELGSASEAQRYTFVLGKVDAMLGTTLTSLPTDGERAPIIAITADHGEGFGDHGAPYHSTDLYNSQIRVPLVIAGPGVVPGRRLEPVGLADVAPTLLELAGYRAPGLPEMDGRSVADLLTGRSADDPDGGFAYSEMVPDRHVAEARRALVTGRWKLIESKKGVEL
jgi:hypothetical protein